MVSIDRPASIPATLLGKLVDPIDHSELEIDGQGIVSASGNIYPVTGGVPVLKPARDFLLRYFGSRNLKAWASLQEEAERSYEVREEGHFSVSGYKPGVEFGAMLAELPAGEFLDVGCGKLARPAYMPDGSAIDFFGVDPMDIHTARSFPYVRAYGDFLPFRAESFDCVFFASSLDHAINPLRCIEEAHRVLRKGGYLAIWTTIRPSDVRLAKWASAAAYFQTRYNALHNWGFTRESIERLVSILEFQRTGWRTTSDAAEEVLLARKAG